MTLVPATSVGGAATVGVTQIVDSTLGVAAGSIDITGIAATYSHLQLYLLVRGDTAAISTGLNLSFNNDSSASYYLQYQVVRAAVTSAGEGLGQTSAAIVDMAAASAGANFCTHAVIFINNYAGTVFNKGGYCTGANLFGTATTNTQIEPTVFSWNNTAAINRIKLTPSAGNIIIGSRYTLYGLT